MVREGLGVFEREVERREEEDQEEEQQQRQQAVKRTRDMSVWAAAVGV